MMERKTKSRKTVEDKSEKNIYFCTRRVELNYAHNQIYIPMFHRQRYNHVPFH